MKASLLLSLALAPLGALADGLNKEPAPQGSQQLRPAAARWADLGKAESPSFRRHVVPLMSRLGCNGRECHGAFSGQGGFQLSLFGYDFEKDHREMTADAEDGVRVELKDPVASLILQKPALDGEKHKGKKIIDKGAWEYKLLLKWIQDGARLDVAETGEFHRLEVLPKELVFKQKGDTVQLKVLAHWKDGTVEDVTQITRFRTNDESVADVSGTGLVTCKEKGDTHIVAFYDNGVEPVPAMLPVSTKPYPTVQTRTKVDELVVQKLRKAGIVPSEIATDAEFLRRASLDVTGTLPAPQEIETFLADESPNKRAKKIDELLSRPAYAAWWATKFSDFTGNNQRELDVNFGEGRSYAGTMSRQWFNWIYKRVADNQPYDQFAAGIVLATSRTSPTQTFEEYVREMSSYFRRENPADFAERPNLPYYWQRRNVAKPEEKSLAFAHTFLGVRIECAECHKHPFDQWTKTDFAQFKEFFTTMANFDGREAGARMMDGSAPAAGDMTNASLRKEIGKKVEASLPKHVIDPKTSQGLAAYVREYSRRVEAGEPSPWPELHAAGRRVTSNDEPKNKVQGSARVITPKLLGGQEVVLQQYHDPREPLMQWLKDKDNPYFARLFVNRVWASYFHRGIVEPTDDLNLANPPVNEPLMEHLARGFVAHGYDMKWLHREILNSDAYQRSWKTNETNKLDDKNFSHAVIRRLPAETVSDAITMATASAARVATFATDISDRAIGPVGNIADRISGAGKNVDGYTLAIFGKPAREANCDCERTADPTLLQTIYTRNDPTLLSRIDLNSRNTWLDELRKSFEFNPEKELAAARDRLRLAEEKLASLIPLENPGADAPLEAQEAYHRKNLQYRKAVTEAKNRVAELKIDVADAAKPIEPFHQDKAIREVFLRTVSRPPSEEEFTKARADVAAATSPLVGIRELLFALLNTREFMVNR